MREYNTQQELEQMVRSESYQKLSWWTGIQDEDDQCNHSYGEVCDCDNDCHHDYGDVCDCENDCVHEYGETCNCSNEYLNDSGCIHNPGEICDCDNDCEHEKGEVCECEADDCIHNPGEMCECEDQEDGTEHVYDVQYIINSDGSLAGCRLWTAVGGPSIHLDTEKRLMIGRWGSDYADHPMSHNLCDDVDDFWKEMLDSVRS